MKKKEELVTFGLTEKQADEVMLLESRMMEEAVKLRFVKKDGTVREAETFAHEAGGRDTLGAERRGKA